MASATLSHRASFGRTKEGRRQARLRPIGTCMRSVSRLRFD